MNLGSIKAIFHKDVFYGTLENYRDQHKFLHDLDKYRIPDKFSCRIDLPDTNQTVIIERLVAYYHRMKNECACAQNTGLNDMWQHICKGHAAFELALENKDISVVSEMLLNVCDTPGLVVGFENSIKNASSDHRRFLCLNAVDKLLALGEALGCIPVQCPEQGVWGYQNLDIDHLLELIRLRLPFDIAPPSAGGCAFGYQTKYGVLSERNIQSIHTAYSSVELLAESKKKIVCEIGGGIGSLTYYLAKAGMDEISLFDLPTVSVIQAYYLAKSLGPDMVWLYGEPRCQSKVRLLPFWQFDEVPEKYFSLVVNQDSMPEIARNTVLHYFKLMSKNCEGYFLSINQEGRGPNIGDGRQSVVFELIEAAGGFRRIQRCPDWMRGGYVAEVYKRISP